VHHLQFSAFEVEHVEQLLSAEVSFLKSDPKRLQECASRIHQRTSGVARLVHYGLRYVREKEDTDLDEFVSFLLNHDNKKDVERCFQRRDLAGAFFALAEFALWKLPLKGDDKFKWEQLALAPDEMTHLRNTFLKTSHDIEVSTCL
jgi:hypothetical protein